MISLGPVLPLLCGDGDTAFVQSVSYSGTTAFFLLQSAVPRQHEMCSPQECYHRLQWSQSFTKKTPYNFRGVQYTATQWLMQIDGEWYPKGRLGGMFFPLVNQQKRRHNGLAFQFLYINLRRAMPDIAQMSDAVYNCAGNVTQNKIVSLISLETVYAWFRLAIFSLLRLVQTLYQQYCKMA